MNVWQWIDQHNVLNLATIGDNGPWSAAVYYARDGRRLVFLSSSRSEHARNLAIDSRCSATISGDAPDWSSIRGVQLSGHARLLEGAQAEAARAVYFSRFEDMMKNADRVIKEALERIDWYELVPERLLFIDNSRGFGHRDAVI